MYTGISVAKDCYMIPSNINLAVITATPGTEEKNAEIKIEPTLGQTLNVIIQNITYMFRFFLVTIRKSLGRGDIE